MLVTCHNFYVAWPVRCLCLEIGSFFSASCCGGEYRFPGVALPLLCRLSCVGAWGSWARPLSPLVFSRAASFPLLFIFSGTCSAFFFRLVLLVALLGWIVGSFRGRGVHVVDLCWASMWQPPRDWGRSTGALCVLSWIHGFGGAWNVYYDCFY
jgi:hypothetical protein